MAQIYLDSKTEEKICVIGGGIIGLFCAISLQERGKKVVLIERDEIGGRQAASFGNGCWINPGAIMPISFPGLWRYVPGYLLDSNGPFSIRWQHLPKLAGWLIRFIWAGRDWKQIEDQVAKRLPLLKQPVERYVQLAKQAGVEHLILQSGVMYLYRRKEELDADERGWQLRRDSGVSIRILASDELRQVEPDLSPEYQYGVLMKDGATLADPGAYCEALGKLFLKNGGAISKGEVTDFAVKNGKLSAVHMGANVVNCDKAIIAAGAWSKPLAAKLGDRVPLISERGYHVTIQAPDVKMNHGLMPSDGKMAVVRTTSGLRFAGQVELASLEATPRWERAKIQLKHAYKMFPQLKKSDTDKIDMWMGHRPSTPDSIPVICQSSKTPDVIYAFGHGHTGISMAPDTGLLVADLVDGIDQARELAEYYSAKRF